MNDDIRRRVFLNEVLSSHAYMLFYVREDPRQQAPVVPPSHVTPPSSKKRCAPHGPLGWGHTEDGEIADIDSVPLCKRAKYQQQLQQQQETGPTAVSLDSVFADVQTGVSHSADSAPHSAAVGSSHAKTGLLSQHSSLHADLNGNGSSSAGVSNGGFSIRQSRQHCDEEEGMGEDGGGGPGKANGNFFIGPPCRALPDPSRPPQASGQPSSGGNGAAGAKPDQHAANSPTLADANSPSPAGDTHGAAAASLSLAGDTPKRSGFMSFSLVNPLKGRSHSKLGSAAASASEPPCMTPPSQRLSSAPSCLEQQASQPAQRKKTPTSPIKPITFGDEPDIQCGHKRSRAESFATTELKAESDVELELEDEVPAAKACRTHMETPPDPPASSEQSQYSAPGTLLGGPHLNGFAASKSSTRLLVSFPDAMLLALWPFCSA